MNKSAKSLYNTYLKAFRSTAMPRTQIPIGTKFRKWSEKARLGKWSLELIN